jgi:Predicted AAA-ATPase/PD-(D/E)XK nuclease superfamily
MQQLPIGEQNFRKLREAGMLYVDKTEHICALLTGSNYCFLSRPRRFGKSLTLSTIEEIFQGNRDVFKGLWIENNWDWPDTHPVIHISFNRIGYAEIGLEAALIREMERHASNFGIQLESQTPGLMLREVLLRLADRHKPVVLLIDEYDKPIIDYLDKDELPVAKNNRATLKTFYSGLKDHKSQAALRFFLITGVSKFSQVSIFSDLNYLDDITFENTFAALTGYTQAELETNFKNHLEHLHLAFKDMGRDELLERIRLWYNGYSWDGVTRVYNPFSILNLLKKRAFDDYWFKTGTATFLMKKIREQKLYQLNDLRVSGAVFENYDLENMDTRSLLFQTGYLTIKSVDRTRNLYTLDLPNREVEEALTNHLVASLLNRNPADSINPVLELENAFLKNDLERVMQVINAMLKDLPSHIVHAKDEHFYHALVHLHFRYLGLFIESEPHTSDGRMDAVVQTPTHIYILEFKLDESAASALEQIRAKRYADKYRVAGKTTVGIGINFESGKKAVGGWLSELV